MGQVPVGSLLQLPGSSLEAELQGEKNMAKGNQEDAPPSRRGVIRTTSLKSILHALPTNVVLFKKSLCPHAALPCCLLVWVCFFFSLGISRRLKEVQDINSTFLILLGLGLVEDFPSNIQLSLHSWLSFPNI